MKKNAINSRIISLILSLLFTGCTGKIDKENDTTSTAASSQNSTSTAPVLVSTEPSRLKFLVPENDTTSLPFAFADREKVPAWQEFERVLKENNIELEFELIEPSQYKVVMQTRLAARLEMPDIINVGALDTTTKNEYARNGLFIPINDIISNNCKPETIQYIQNNYPHLLSAQASPEDSKAYWYAQTTVEKFEGEFNRSYRTLLIRNDWLQKLGIEMPRTTQEFYDACIAFHEQDANGNGIIGDEKMTAGVASGWVLKTFGGYFGLVAGITGVICDENRVVSPWYQEGMKPFVEYVKLLYDKNILEISESASNNQLNAENSLLAVMTYPTLTTFDLSSSDKNAAFLPMPLLTAVDGIKPLAPFDAPQNFAASISFAVTNACKDEEGVARLFDMLYSDWYYTLSEWGIEGQNWKYSDSSYLNGMFDVGRREYIVAENDVQANKDAGIATGYRLWGKGIFPRINTKNHTKKYYDAIISQFEADGDKNTAYRYKMELESFSYPKTYITPDAYYALPTAEQNEQLDLLNTDLETYHAELLTDLITGAKSLDNWGTYMKELKDLGLDEVIQINQDRYDRRIGVK